MTDSETKQVKHYLVLEPATHGRVIYNCGGKEPCECVSMTFPMMLGSYPIVPVDQDSRTQMQELRELRLMGKVAHETESLSEAYRVSQELAFSYQQRAAVEEGRAMSLRLPEIDA